MIKDKERLLIINKEDIHIDHVIPWSFIYSDEMWNLVVMKFTTNLNKGNRLPTKDEIDKLKGRNVELMNLIKDDYNLKNQIYYSLEHNSLDKLFNNIKG